jgi:hypothetical protein
MYLTPPAQLAQIEHRLDLPLPALFKRLWSDGMMSEGEAPAARVSLLAFVFDFIPVPLSEILAVREDMQRVFNVAVDEHRLVPFARTEQGDHICFYYGGAADSADIPIAYLPCDEDDAHIRAKNLEDYIFRSLLEEAARPPASGLGEARRQFAAMVASHIPYLGNEKAQLLREICSEPARKNAKAILGAASAKRHIKQHLSFARLNTQFRYTA